MAAQHIENRRSRRPAYGSEPLGSGRCRHLAALIAGVAPDWSVELHYDEDGGATIVIMPEDPDDNIRPTFIVYASGATFHLDELRGDNYRGVGAHAAWTDVLRAVQIRLAWEMTSPATLH